METVGSYLKQQREREGVSLETIASSTKIRVSLLQALEDDRLSELPSGIFLRGFVRAYAEALRVRPERALEVLDSQTAPATPTATPYVSPMAGEEEPAQGSRFKMVHLVVLLVALLSMLGIYFVTGNSPEERAGYSTVQTTDANSGTTKSFSPLSEGR